MIHYHGCPITPRETLYTLAGKNFCNSFADSRDTKICHEIGQANMLDNGAFTSWKQSKPMDWKAWAEWVQPWLDYKTTWCVLPDAVDGGEDENDRLLGEWSSIPGAPVWHLDESLTRLASLCDRWERVCFGSAGAYSQVGTRQWHHRVTEAFNVLADADGKVRVWVHMLRGMSLAGSHYPFASVDSTDVARNHHLLHKNALSMVQRWDGLQCPALWRNTGEQLEIGVA